MKRPYIGLILLSHTQYTQHLSSIGAEVLRQSPSASCQHAVSHACRCTFLAQTMIYVLVHSTTRTFAHAICTIPRRMQMRKRNEECGPKRCEIISQQYRRSQRSPFQQKRKATLNLGQGDNGCLCPQSVGQPQLCWSRESGQNKLGLQRLIRTKIRIPRMLFVVQVGRKVKKSKCALFGSFFQDTYRSLTR